VNKCRSGHVQMVARGGVEPPTCRFSDGRHSPTGSHGVRFSTICSEISVSKCHTVSMNATRSSRILSPASHSGSLYGSTIGVPMAAPDRGARPRRLGVGVSVPDDTDRPAAALGWTHRAVRGVAADRDHCRSGCGPGPCALQALGRSRRARSGLVGHGRIDRFNSSCSSCNCVK